MSPKKYLQKPNCIWIIPSSKRISIPSTRSIYFLHNIFLCSHRGDGISTRVYNPRVFLYFDNWIAPHNSRIHRKLLSSRPIIYRRLGTTSHGGTCRPIRRKKSNCHLCYFFSIFHNFVLHTFSKPSLTFPHSRRNGGQFLGDQSRTRFSTQHHHPS